MTGRPCGGVFGGGGGGAEADQLALVATEPVGLRVVRIRVNAYIRVGAQGEKAVEKSKLAPRQPGPSRGWGAEQISEREAFETELGSVALDRQPTMSATLVSAWKLEAVGSSLGWIV